MRDTTTTTVQRLDRTGRWVDLMTGMAPEAADGLVARLAAETGRAYRVDDTDATTGPMADAIRAAERAVASDRPTSKADAIRASEAIARPAMLAARAADARLDRSIRDREETDEAADEAADEAWGSIGDGGWIAGRDFRVYWMAGFGDERPYPPIGRRLGLRELHHDVATSIVDRLNRQRPTGERGEWTIRRIR